MRTIDLNRQLLGIEDLLIGFGVITQTRGGQTVSITKINASSLPFDETQSLLQWAQAVNLAGLGAMTDELQAIYTSIEALNNLEDNLVALNTLAQAINCLNNLCNNLTKLQNIDTNMTKLQNIDTNMTKLQNIDTNMTELSSIYSNMNMLQTIYDNMTNLNAINSQIIPNLSEILLVDDYAAQVSADKASVANDKASVASMKLAVETIYDTFDDRFLGTKTNDPILDNDGNPLVDGAMYFNTSVNALKVYDLDNALWVTIPQIYLSGLLDVTLTSITTGDILTWNGSKWINTRTPSFDSIKLNGGTSTNGTATWNNTEYTYDIVLNPNVTLQVGQEDLVYCKNNSASVIANGRPVMAVGTNGNSGNILVDLHDGTKANARRIIGIATEDLTANGYGFVTINGKVRGINTTGSQYGEAWANGDILYVKATGNLTNVEPVDTALKMPIAFVIHAHTNGTLYVRTTGIDENHDRDFINNLADIHSKTAKTTLADTDEFMTADSTSSWSLKKITWASIKTALTSFFTPRVTTTTNKAIARYSSTTGDLQNSSITIDDNGNIGSGTQSFNGFGGSGFKNYIINGDFGIWQRGTNFTGLTNGTYSSDRWVVYDAAGTINYNVIRNASVFTGGYGATYTWNSGTALRSVIQFIENVTRFKVGSKVTISFEAFTNSTPYTVAVAIQGVKGVWASATGEATSNITLTNTKTKYSVTLSIPDWTSLGIDWAHLEDTKLALKFNLGVETNGRDFILGSVQLEDGSVATPLEQRPYGLELALCKRYYEANIKCGYVGASPTLGVSYGSNFNMTPKRIAPVMSLSYAGDTLSFPSGMPSIDEISVSNFRAYKNSTSTGGQVYWTSLVNASAEL